MDHAPASRPPRLAATLTLLTALSTSAAGHDDAGVGHALAWSDFDGDGLADVLVLPPRGAPRLLQNGGAGAFLDRSELLPESEALRWTTAAWIDFDRDEIVDLFAVDAAGGVRLLHNLGAGELLDVTEAVGLAGLAGVRAADWTDYDRDGWFDLVLSEGAGMRFLRNDRGTFVALELPRTAAPAVALAGSLATGAEPPRSGAGAEAEPGSAPEREPDRASERASERARQPAGVPPSRAAAGARAGTNPAAAMLPGTSTATLVPQSCIPRIEDQAAGTCLTASSAPTLGSLYPLGKPLFVGADERIGFGTTAPQSRLHLVGDGDVNIPSFAVVEEDFVVDATEPVLGLYGRGGAWGAAITLSEVGSFQGIPFLADKWALARENEQDGSRLYFTYGSDPDHRVNAPVLTLETGGNVGIGTSDPFFPLHVAKGSSLGTALYVSSKNAFPAVDVRPGPGGDAAFFAGTIRIGVEATGGFTVPKVEFGTDGANDGGRAVVLNDFGNEAVRLAVDGTHGGYVRVKNGGNQQAVLLDTDGSGSGYIELARADGTPTLTLFSDYANGNSRIVTDVLEVTGGADLVELFDVDAAAAEPGTVLVIDDRNPGELRISTEPYDRKVAGAVSGAGGVRPGISLGQDELSGETSVALSGRVWMKASAENGAIRAGDRLTTSTTPGHAMRATDLDRTPGAVLGKAMTPLSEGTGLVLVLVGLQ